MPYNSMKDEDKVQASTDDEINCLRIEKIVVYRCYNTLSTDSEVNCLRIEEYDLSMDSGTQSIYG